MRDNWPVSCGELRQWIVEDRFVLGRPGWEQAGARFVAGVHPYELTKIRLLNGSHSPLGCLAYLLGYRMWPRRSSMRTLERSFTVTTWNR